MPFFALLRRSWGGRRIGCAALLYALGLSGRTLALESDTGTVFRAEPTLDYAHLEHAVRRSSPDLKPAQREAALAVLEVAQARMFANPTLDLSWGTLPVGRTTPSDLERPWANVPNYGVGVAYTFPILKRGPRQHRAAELARGAQAELDLSARELALALAAVLGDLATATLRREGMEELVRGGEHSVALASARLRAKYGTPLEVDRLSVDVLRSRQLLLGVTAEIDAALASCGQLLGTRCANFVDGTAARSYLERWTGSESVDEGALAERPDLRALDARIAASHASAELAAAQAVPDPTLRLGYLNDRFVISGNQRHSLNLSLSIPLPIFERGKIQKRVADTARRHFAEERTRRVAAARARIPQLKERLVLQRGRCAAMTGEVLPQGRAVLRGLEKAAEARLISLGDVILARRTVSELLIEEADSCGDAYQAALELMREIPRKGE